jgi:hypothetical protein
MAACPNVLISVEEYDRLGSRDQRAVTAAEASERFLADIEALAVRDIA